MWVLILFSLFAVIVCITAFIRGASAVNAEGHVSLIGKSRAHDDRDRDVA